MSAKLAPFVGLVSFIVGSQVLHNLVKEYLFTAEEKKEVKAANKEEVALNLPVIEFSAFFNKDKVFFNDNFLLFFLFLVYYCTNFAKSNLIKI